MTDIRIRKVKTLRGRAREATDAKRLSPDDLVIITTTIKRGCLPEYEVEKIVGDPVSFLLERIRKGGLKA